MARENSNAASNSSMPFMAALLMLVASTLPTAIAKMPASCPKSTEYRASNGCMKCVSTTSPFFTMRGGPGMFKCYRPTTLSAASTKCTDLVLPAFIRSNQNPMETRMCLNFNAKRITIALPTTSDVKSVKKLTPEAYIKASLRLADILAPRTVGKDAMGNPLVISIIREQGGNKRLFVQFDGVSSTLKRQMGKTVRLTGVLRRRGELLDVCFVSYLKVCGKASG